MTWLFFLIYLGYSAYQKYFSAGQTADQPYLMNALLVLSITMIGPFFVSYLLTRATQLTGRTPAILLGFISAISLSVLGYWTIWKFFSGRAVEDFAKTDEERKAEVADRENNRIGSAEQAGNAFEVWGNQ